MSDEQALSRLRHDLRGHLNLIRLCTATLELGGEREELLEWVDHIEAAADEAIHALDQIKRLNGPADANADG